MISYFIAYMAVGGAVGNHQVTMRRPIRSIEDIKEIAEVIDRDCGMTGTIVIGWQRFETEADR
jgi:hypothetical protein